MLGIILIILFILVLILLLRIYLNHKELKNIFKNYNVAVFGAKGSGKDALFQKAINMRKEPYLSTMNYGGNCELIDLNTLSCDPNNYENFINGMVTHIPKNDLKECRDIYLTDCGIYLPSTYDMYLSKKYMSLPIYYALSRQLYNQSIHFNTQALNRVWVKLREQADFYILCRQCKSFLGMFLKINITYYDNYESACRKLAPVNKRLLNKFQRAESDIYNASNGLIKNSFVLLNKKKIKYDTRYFHKVVFNDFAPSERDIRLINRENYINGKSNKNKTTI